MTEKNMNNVSIKFWVGHSHNIFQIQGSIYNHQQGCCIGDLIKEQSEKFMDGATRNLILVCKIFQGESTKYVYLFHS
jgi:hypothetical protein